MTDSLRQHNVESAFALHQAERYADAARIYQALLDADPDDATVLHLFGVMHHQCGHGERAIELIGRAVELRPEAAAYHANLAEALRAVGRFEEAAASCRAALKLRADYPEARNNLGLALHGLAQYEVALAEFDAALALRPEFAMAHNNRGTTLVSMGEKEKAVEAYRAALAVDAKLALAHANLGQLLTDEGKLLEGLAHCQEAVQHGPELAAAHNNLGNVLRGLERWAEASEAYAAAIRLQPDLALAHANAGLTHLRQGQTQTALTYFRRAAELAPHDGEIWRQLAQAYGEADEWPSAIECCGKLVELKPDDADAHNSLGWACQSDSRYVEAKSAYRRALELMPEHFDALLNLGSLHEELGAMDDAEACFRQTEASHPRSPLPLARRAMLVRGRLNDADRDRLRTELYRPCPPMARMNLLYALAHVADARGDYGEAAACLEPANALAGELRRSRYETYDRDEHARYVDRLIAAFTPELFERLVDSGHETNQPVFVFGMPRSGTTLVEQVLASHSQVYGAGEMPFARRAMNALPSDAERPDDLVAALATLDGDNLRKLATGYLDAVNELLDRDSADRPGRVVDKMPDNYLYLGLIALMFPRATLIHVRRDARDVALSCWMTHFRSIRWADQHDDLAGRIAGHRRLAEHWQTALPRRVIEVRYGALVENFESEARRLVGACGLEWEPACLRFHETSRPVRTASVTQVRRPLYRQSLARWKSYEPYLASLFDRLQEG